MWRKEEIYDVCIVMEWKIEKRRRGWGSEILFKIERKGYKKKEGWIELKREDMERIMKNMKDRKVISVMRWKIKWIVKRKEKLVENGIR